MILQWMIYAMGLSAALAIGGHLLGRSLRDLGRPTRFAWASSIVASVILPWIPSRPSPDERLALGSEFLGLATGEAVAVTSTYLTLDRLLVRAWLISSLILLLWTAVSILLARRRASRWSDGRLAGHTVLVSDATGPAVTGFLRGRIVVPEWLVEWDHDLQRLIVGHELEHLRAHDPLLRLVGIAACIAVPWNLVVWWQRKQLELAIEYDCDHRVLVEYPDPDAYGNLLLKVAETSRADRLVGPAFSLSASTLERRIKVILNRRRKNGRVGPVFVTVAAVGLVLGAFSCSGPAAPSADSLAFLAAPEPEGAAVMQLPTCPSLEVVAVADVPSDSDRSVSLPDGTLIYLSGNPLVTSVDLAGTHASPIQDQYSLNVDLTAEAATRVQVFSEGNVGRRMAFLVDGNVVRVPTIKVPLTGDGVMINPFTQEEAEGLADAFSIGCGL